MIVNSYALAPLVLVAGVSIVFFIKRVRKRELRGWRARFPVTYEEYVDKHPECVHHNKGNRCYNCGSGYLNSLGLFDANDRRRSVSCNHCGNSLYRIEPIVKLKK